MATEMKENFEIKKLTSFKIGGQIARVYSPENEAEFVEIMQREPEAVVLGNLSNILISDSGYSGAIILTSNMNKIVIDGLRVVAECGVKGQKLAQEVEKWGLQG